MNYNLVIRGLAALEISEAYQWYESKQFGLGEKFLKALDNFFELIKRNPHRCSFLKDRIRQGRINKFPYLIIYEVFENEVVVYSVFNAWQNPSRKRTS